MFTKHIPRTGNPVGKSHSVFTRVSAAIGSIALASGIALAGAPAANATTPNAAWAQARFLSGDVLGINLDDIAELQAAQASNNGNQAKQWQDDPLKAELLSSIPVDTDGGIQLSLGDVLNAGAVGQYAEAEKNGDSMAATGAVDDDGGAGVGRTAVGPAGDLTLDLDALLDSQFASVLSDLKLDLRGVSSQAAAQLSVASGSYSIAGATLTFTSPAVADLSSKVAAALDGVDKNLIAIGSDDGELGNAVDKVLDPVLGAIGSSANVTVDIDSDLQGAVTKLLTSSYGNGAVSFDLQTGAVRVDLATLLGGDLNSLPPNTEILSGTVINRVLKGITDTVSTLADNIVDKVRDALHDATVTVHADLDLLSPQDGGSSTVCHIVDLPVVGDILGNVLGNVLGGDVGSVGDLLDLPGVTQLSDLTNVLSPTQLTELTNALGVTSLTQLDGLTDLSSLTNALSNGTGGLGGGLKGLFGRTLPNHTLAKPTLCEVVQNILPDLESTVNVDIVGTVDDLIGGSASQATVAISLLNGTVPVNLNTNLVLSSLGSGLEDGLFGENGSVKTLTDNLNTGLVNPAVTGLLGDGNSVSTVLTDLVSLKANVQELSPTGGGNMFTETALRLTVSPGVDLNSVTKSSGGSSLSAGSSNGRLVRVNLAQSAVGPNATVVVPPVCTNGNCTPCTSNCTPIPDPCFTNCGTSTASDRLAYTGVGIATLVAIILALLAAGAYMAREGYRRNHTKSLTSD